MATREEKLWKHYRQEKAHREAGALTKKTEKLAPVRHKNWASVYLSDPDGYDDLDIAHRERVMPEGEIEWLQAKVVRSPLHNGFGLAAAAVRAEASPEQAATPPRPGHLAGWSQTQGTVVEVASDLCRVSTGERTLLCTLRSSLRVPHSGYSNMIAAGDEVIVSQNGQERGIVEALLPRRSALARPDPFNALWQQVVVANVDQVLIVASWREPAFWPELVDRYLIAALRHNLTPFVCINKVDLADDPAPLRAALMAYRRAGCRVLPTSVVAGSGLDELRELLQGKTTALAGLSGVGKSSLLSAVEPGLNLRVGDVSDRRHEGRHTTTQVTLHRLRGGGFVADTPGMREFGLAGLKPAEIAGYYPEITAEARGCAYTNCSHTREPGCAVKTAVRTGRLSAMRYDSYRKIREGLAS